MNMAAGLRRRTIMMIRVLGCSGAIAAGCRTTAFALDDDILIDAGTGVGDLTLDELTNIEHIVVSHSHLDHVLSIGLLADSVMRRRVGRPPIQVHALPETLEALRKHVFNGVIWPDFTRLPSADKPVLAFVPFKLGDVLDLGGRRIEVLSAAHTVPAVGFAVEGRDGALGVHRRHRTEPGAVDAAARHERAAPGDRDRVQRRGTYAGAHQPASVPDDARPGTARNSPTASPCTSRTSSRAKWMR